MPWRAVSRAAPPGPSCPRGRSHRRACTRPGPTRPRAAGSIAFWSRCAPWWSATSCASSATSPAGARVLEVGAGDGRFVSRLRAAGFEAEGIEPSEGGVRVARARGARVARAALEERGPRARKPRRGDRLARARAPGRSGWGPGADRHLVAPGRPRRGRLSQPGQPPGPNRWRSVVSSGRAAPPDPLHRDRVAPAARALQVPAGTDQPPPRGAESARDVADAAQSADAGPRRGVPGAEAGPRTANPGSDATWR